MLNAKLAQAALAKAGFYAGEIDGDFGPASRAARDKALAASGVNADRWPHSRKQLALTQWALKEAGFDPGSIDGLDGPKTRAAEYAFARPAGVELPWITEAEKALGLHEVMDHDALAAFLRRDGSTSGDPRTVPWCGDFVQTTMALALSKEKLPKNPYAARNWQDWGEDATGLYGAVIVFWRGKRSGWQGHVGYAINFDAARGLVEVLGGNQSNAVTRAWLSTDRILAWRAPKDWASKMTPIAKTDAGNVKTSTNEA